MSTVFRLSRKKKFHNVGPRRLNLTTDFSSADASFTRPVAAVVVSVANQFGLVGQALPVAAAKTGSALAAGLASSRRFVAAVCNEKRGCNKLECFK
jgi:hypothetical protein